MSKNPDTKNELCGNCKHFVAGGLCELVKGQIKAKDTCDLFEYGQPKTMDTKVDPKHNKIEVNYRPGFMVETVSGDIVQKALQMYQELLSRGIPENEVYRAVVQYFSEPEPPYAMAWPGPTTGLDLVARIEPFKVVATREPLTNFDGLPQDVQPYPTSNKSPYGIGGTYQNNPTPDPNSVGSMSNTYDFKHPPAPQSANWTGLASDVNSEPSMHNEHGFNATKLIPEWRYPIEDSQMYQLKIPDIQIPPSGTNPLAEAKRIKEAVDSLRSQFGWLTEDYISKARELAEDVGGQLYLVRAASETVTDHRSEGEPYRRKLSADELNSMTRTAIGKKMDINHQPEYETDATILDAEFDKNRKEIQMLIMERDPQINEAINSGKITAVSINGGTPRSETIEPCDHGCTNNCELCLVPRGVVLGEADDIGMTFVVTDPNGLYYNGNFIPSAEPGIKVTLIESL